MTQIDIVGLKEMAERLGVKQQTAAAWRHRGLLPPPEGTVSGAPAWTWATIERWAIQTGRFGGVAEFIAERTRGWRLLDGVEVDIMAGVVVRQVSPPFPLPLADGRLQNRIRILANDGNWYELDHDAYLRGIGAADDATTRLGKALLAGAALFGAIVVANEASKSARPPI
jgi:hypothetical protein